MVLSIISVGSKLTSWESSGIDYYSKQFPKNTSLKFIEIKGQQHPKRSNEEVLKIESEMILSKIPSDHFIVSWDSKGELLDSIKFSEFFSESMLNNLKICFVIGGSFGLSKSITDRSDKVFSASYFTFPHRLFRIILIEQIYRAFSIINNAPYHK